MQGGNVVGRIPHDGDEVSQQAGPDGAKPIVNVEYPCIA